MQHYAGSVFVSYCDDEKHYYDAISQLLTQAGITLWNSDNMQPGKGLSEQLRSGIEACDACIFVATNRSIESHWCLLELGAFWHANKPVVPWLADNQLQQEDLPPHLKSLLSTMDVKKAVDTVLELITNSTIDQKPNKALSVEAFEKDRTNLEEIASILESLDKTPEHARLIQFSGMQVCELLRELLKQGAKVDLLLAHPVQVLNNPNVEMRKLQMNKMATFHDLVAHDFPNSEQLHIRYYLSPASIRGIVVDDLLSCLGWYTYRQDMIYGHDNASVLSRSQDSIEDPLRITFDGVWKDMWDRGIPFEEDRQNVERILQYRPQAEGDIRVDGIVVKGHGVASGSSRSDGLGTIKMQKKMLEKLLIDWDTYWPGTINVCIAPYRCTWRNEPTFSREKWSLEQPAEDFGLAWCEITVFGKPYDALAYCPLPRTKTQNFHNASIVEVIAPCLPELKYGDTISLLLKAEYFIIDE